MANKILIIHPLYARLNFLGKSIRLLMKKYPKNTVYYRLDTTDESHYQCLKGMRSESDALLLFFCHGTPKNIRGCVRDIDGPRRYQWGTLISPTTNIDVFSEKKIICVACDSKTLAENALNAGAKVYLGFDVVRFYWPLSSHHESVPTHTSKRSGPEIKFEFRRALEESLVSAFDQGYTFNQLSTHIAFRLQVRANRRLMTISPKIKLINIEVARALIKIKEGLTLVGDGELRVFDKDF